MMEKHARNLGLSEKDLVALSKKKQELLFSCKTALEWEYRNMSKDELLERCRTTLAGFKKSFSRQSKKHILQLLMNPTDPSLIVPVKDNDPLHTMKKKDLVAIAEKHGSFKKSMARQTKDVLIAFIRQHNVHVPSSPDNNRAPRKNKSILLKMTKQQLLDEATHVEGFCQTQHGKTKKTLVDFLSLSRNGSKTQEFKIEKNKDDDNGGTCSPVRVSSYIDDPDELKKRILHVLMRTEPFSSSTDLEKDVSLVF